MQIDEVFGFPANGLYGAFNSLSRQIVTVDGPPPPKPAKREAGTTTPPVVTIANGMFLQKDSKVRDAFLRTLAAQYGAGVRVVDFTAGDEAESALNGWADEQTAGRIKRVFDGIDPTTKLVLANTVYFRADWKEQFLRIIQGQTFTRSDGSTVQTALMAKLAMLNYAAGDGWQVVELPYAGGAFAMWVLVPTGPVDGAEPGRLLAPETLVAVAAGLTQTQVQVFLPRWDFKTRPDLEAALKALGLTAPFGPRADFSGISNRLYIDQAMHAANITVDEWGTEAAAITAIALEPISASTSGRGRSTGGPAVRLRDHAPAHPYPAVHRSGRRPHEEVAGPQARARPSARHDRAAPRDPGPVRQDGRRQRARRRWHGGAAGSTPAGSS